MSGPRTLDVVITPEEEGQRIDHAVAHLAGISIHRAKELLGEGRVREGRRVPKKGERASSGMRLRIELPPSEAPVPQPELPLSVLWQDDVLLALDKPAGLSMHPLAPGETGTLANALLARFPDVTGASPEERCPGLVHRLDRETSGVVLWARRREAFDALRAQFAARSVEKRYLALVEGFVEGAGELAVPLAHDPKNASRMLAAPYPAEAEELKARTAITRYRALGLGDGATLLDVEIPTGVMHQIRAHFAFVGHPVIGDVLYGARPRESERHFLHAASISFDVPGGGRTTVAAPLPADFRAALASVGILPP